MGDFNAITSWLDTKNMTLSTTRALMWPWLRGLEISKKMVDLVAQEDVNVHPPLTRTRGYGTSASRLDCVLCSRVLFPLLSAKTIPFQISGPQGPLSDHDPILMDLFPFQKPAMNRRTPCFSWNRKHIRLYHKTIGKHPIIAKPDDLPTERLYKEGKILQEAMIEAALSVNG